MTLSRALLDDCCDHMLAIERSRIVVTQGNFSAWWREIQARNTREQTANQRLKKEIGRLQAARTATPTPSGLIRANF